ncbi:hypothetical protein, partial [Mixta sp.]|uniref:hypothetical protein n=1 Tax=Mixta sp. TaxID=2100765 RepID=UPI0025880900
AVVCFLFLIYFLIFRTAERNKANARRGGRFSMGHATSLNCFNARDFNEIETKFTPLCLLVGGEK